MNVENIGATAELITENAFEPIAVIGIGCRFPGGIDGPDAYWNFLKEKRCGIGEIPKSRWDLDAFYAPEPEARGKSYARWGGFLHDDVFGFDPGFFDMSPREATGMDPQQRLVLQIAYEAAQDAGVTIKTMQEAQTGVFLGISTMDFGLLLRQGQGAAGGDIFAGTGTAFSISANRISHRFGLTGPSFAVDTACSSALVAIDQAVRHLSMGTCDYALAGGVNCMLDPGPFIAFSAANMLSKTGGIYTFDERADGFVRGEGCGLVLLKRLSQALADGDRIYGVIRQSMVNQDGHTATLTAPSGDAQQMMLRDLVERAAVDPGDVDYVEAHGTGTPVGDPIEATAIGRVFGSQVDRKTPLYVGSFKPNIGHLESAAGVAGFIKALLVAQRGTVLPNRNFDRPNPDIPFDALGITVATEPVAVADTGAVLTAVNSFGFGGTNASVLIEQWHEQPRLAEKARVSPPADQPIMVPVSAQSAEGLKLWAGSLADALGDNGALAERPVPEIVEQLATRRDGFSERAGLIVRPERAALRSALLDLAREGEDETSETDLQAITGRASDRRLAMAYSGQGGQWWAMARQLLQEDREFRAVVDRVDDVLRPMVGWSTAEEMLRSEAESRVNTAEVTQASIFVTQLALFERWKAKGLVPDALIGHSFGEIGAAYCSGIIDLEAAARLIALRGQIPNRCSQRGAMAAIGLTVDQLEPLVADYANVVIAAYNGPVAQTISGVEEDVVRAMADISDAYPDAMVRRIQMDFAWHSTLLDEVEDWFRGELGKVEYREGAIPIISTVTGMIETRFDEEYWWSNLRSPVNYTRAVGLGLDLGLNAYLELGPHRTVTPLIHGIAQSRGVDAVAVTSLARKADDFETLAEAEARLYVSGVDFAHEASTRPLPEMPRMPWHNQRLLDLPEEAQAYLHDPVPHPLLGRRAFTARPSWFSEITLKSFKYLVGHKVDGDVLFPAVGYVEIMGAAIRDQFGDGPVELRDLKLHEATSFGDDEVVLFATSFEPATSKISISTLHRGMDEGWRLRAEAYGLRHDYALDDRPAELVSPDMTAVSKSEFYRLTERHGLQYGPTFQKVERFNLNKDRAVAWLETGEGLGTDAYFAFPGVLDAALQTSIALAAHDDGFWNPAEALPPSAEDTTDYPLRLPVGARKILLAAPLTANVEVDVERGFVEGAIDLRIYSDSGEPLITIADLESKSVGSARGRKAAGQGEEANRVFEEHFEKVDLPAGEPTARRNWLVVGDGKRALDGTLDALKRRGAEVEFAETGPFSGMDAAAARSSIETFMDRTDGAGCVLFCAAGGRDLDDKAAGDALCGAVSNSVHQLVTLAQACEQLVTAGAQLPDVVILTARSRSVASDPALELSGVCDSALIGAGRSMASELQHGDIRLVDADGEAFASGDPIVDVMLADTREREFAVRGAEYFVPRLESHSPDEVMPAMRRLDTVAEDTNFGVTMTSPGSIENIVVREMATPECGPHEVLIEVAAVGLNFRDIMAATSILPGELEGDEAYWRNLGLEFAGRVSAVGEQVSDLAPGDPVMGMGKGFLRRFAKIDASAVIRLPQDFDLRAAATMPVAFLTAHYALRRIAHLEEDETALVHLASGGVGLAAIQVARDAGATVYGTAGSDKKRDYLRALGLGAVMNSRSLEFAEQVLSLTDGRGVDVVLNALSGQGIDKSLECLAPLGRMVEIGKRDLAEDKPIGLGSLYRNNAYSVIDLSTIPDDNPKLFGRLLREVEAKVANGDYKPLEATYFPASQSVEAMRTLFRAEHIGKVVVTFDEPLLDVEIDLTQEYRFAPDASYLVTGGLKGFGVVIADWMSRQGAGTLVLANRSGIADQTAVEAIAAMEARGTRVITASLDVSDMGSVESLFASLAEGDAPLRGIVHGAAVIDDGFIAQMDADRIDRVLQPKVAGALNLQNAAEARGFSLDFFLNMSSIAQTVGSAGQINYTAANSVLDAHAAYRRGRGLAATSVNWGMIAGSGFVSRSESLANYLDSAGIRPVRDCDAANALGTLLRARSGNLGYANLDWDAIGRINPALAENPRIRPVLGDAGRDQSRIQAELMAVAREAWDGLLADIIRRDVAKVLKVEAKDVPDDRKLSELGLDSLSAFELKNRIESQVDIEIPIAQFIQAPTIARLSVLVANAVERKMLAAASAQQAGENGAQGDGGQGNFEPAACQTAAIAVTVAPMSTPAAALEARLFAEASVPDGLSPEILSERLAQLVQREEALRLSASIAEDREIGFNLNASPELEILPADAQLPPVEFPGPLWRFGMATSGQAGKVLQVQTHRAAADSLSPRLLLEQLLGMEDKLGGDARSYRDYLAGASGEDEPDAQRRDLAYWKEALRHAPSLVAIPARGRAPAPAGLGRNRGAMGFLEARLDSVSVPDGASLDCAVLSAFARILANRFGSDALVFDRWFSNRTEKQLAGLLGPMDSSFPVILPKIPAEDGDLLAAVARANGLGDAHKAVDTARLELDMADWLRERNVSLGQFGFAFIDADAATQLASLDSPLDAVALTPNEIQLAVAASDAGLAVRLGVDLDVVTEADARDLFGQLTRRLGASAHEIVWSTKEWSEGRRAAAKADLGDAPSHLTNVDRMIPLMGKQLASLQLRSHPEANDLARKPSILSNEFIIRPQMDIGRLKRALATVTARHDAMRTRFFFQDGKHGAYLEKVPSEIFHMEEVEDEAAAMARAAELAHIDIEFDDPQFRVNLIRFGDEGDLMVTKANHSVMDGYALGLVVEEVVRAYLGLPLPKVEMDIDTYVREFDHAGNPESLARREKFLRDLYADPVPQIPNIGRKAKGLKPNTEIYDYGVGNIAIQIIPAEGQRSIIERAKDAGVTETAMLMAAFARTLGEMGGVDDIIMVVTAAMRHDRRLEYFANFVADMLPVRVRLDDAKSLEDLAVEITEGMDTAIQFGPFQDALYSGEFHDEVVAKGSYTFLYLTGDVTAKRWTEDTTTAPVQRPGASGEIDLGMFKVTPLPMMNMTGGISQELILRRFPAGDGLGLMMVYDVSGYDQAEVEEMVQRVAARLTEQ